MLRAWRRWQDRRRQADGPWAGLFEPHTGRDWVALDLETTGLDPKHDGILSLAAVPGEGARLQLRHRIKLHVQSESPRIASAIAHHRLRPADLRDGPPLQQALQQLLLLIGNRPLVGWCIDFDRRMLDAALQPLFGFRLPNRCIDVRHVYAAHWRRRHPLSAPDLRLEAIAATLGLPLLERHDALGDAVSAGLIYCALSASLG